MGGMDSDGEKRAHNHLRRGGGNLGQSTTAAPSFWRRREGNATLSDDSMV